MLINLAGGGGSFWYYCSLVPRPFSLKRRPGDEASTTGEHPIAGAPKGVDIASSPGSLWGSGGEPGVYKASVDSAC